MSNTNFPGGVASRGVPLPAIGSPWGTHWFVDNANGSDGNLGQTTGESKASIQSAVTASAAGDTIHVKGSSTDYSEDVTGVEDYTTLLGYNFCVEGGGWTTAAQNGTILTLTGALGSRVSGFLFRGNGTTGAAINLSESTANDSDGIVIDNNIFKSTSQDVGSHIIANGCPAYVKVYNNHFTWGVTALNATDASNTSATGWEIIGNYFADKVTNGIYMPLRRSLIKDNVFSDHTVACDTVGYAATNGDYNNVVGNYLDSSYSQAFYQAQTNDDWSGNFSMDSAETEVGDNGITIAVPAS